MSKFLLSVSALLFSFNVFADRVVEIGEKVPNLCWKDASGKNVCVDDFQNKTRVLIFNAGF